MSCMHARMHIAHGRPIYLHPPGMHIAHVLSNSIHLHHHTRQGVVVLAHDVGRRALEEREALALVHDGRHHLSSSSSWDRTDR